MPLLLAEKVERVDAYVTFYVERITAIVDGLRHTLPLDGQKAYFERVLQ